AVICVFVIAYYILPIYIPCTFYILTGVPCPGCGLRRAFLYLPQFQFFNAVASNIMLIPLIATGAISFTLALMDIFALNTTFSRISRFGRVLLSKWGIITIIALLAASWIYNLITKL
ncbi:MAG: DUF2752 domain-containing protein, partial [Defluviitaleaceae bacterium]|nr:DUF2752 domain-containing protein [Defluviitaleaceae bacterium]